MSLSLHYIIFIVFMRVYCVISNKVSIGLSVSVSVSRLHICSMIRPFSAFANIFVDENDNADDDDDDVIMMMTICYHH